MKIVKWYRIFIQEGTLLVPLDSKSNWFEEEPTEEDVAQLVKHCDVNYPVVILIVWEKETYW